MRTVDIESCKVGFRQVEINGRGVLTLNGKRLVIRGVDRHDFAPRRDVPFLRSRCEKKLL